MLIIWRPLNPTGPLAAIKDAFAFNVQVAKLAIAVLVESQYANAKVVLLSELTWSAMFEKVAAEIPFPIGGIVGPAATRLPVGSKIHTVDPPYLVRRSPDVE